MTGVVWRALLVAALGPFLMRPSYASVSLEANGLVTVTLQTAFEAQDASVLCSQFPQFADFRAGIALGDHVKAELTGGLPTAEARALLLLSAGRAKRTIFKDLAAASFHLKPMSKPRLVDWCATEGRRLLDEAFVEHGRFHAKPSSE